MQKERGSEKYGKWPVYRNLQNILFCDILKETEEGVRLMRLQESGEMYLETIFILSKTSDTVRAVDVGEYMGFSKPSVSRAMGLLREGGFVLTDEDGYLKLTDSGREVAQTIYERHTTLAGWLEKLGVPPETAAEDACRIEHVISPESFEAIKKHAEA